MAESGSDRRQSLNPGGVSFDTPPVPDLYAAAVRCVRGVRRNSTDPLASKRLSQVEAHLERLDLDHALREIDRTWRHGDPDALPVLAAIYGRLLSLEGRDHPATLAMLRRALPVAPDPDIAALVAWTLERDGQHDEACRQVASALMTFCVVPGGLLAQVAGLIALGPSGQEPGWVGLGPDLVAHGEFLAREGDCALDVALDGRAAFTRLISGTDGVSRRGFTLPLSALASAARVDVTARGNALLGSGLSYLPDFAVDGRASTRGREITGWARLGWHPLRRPQIRLTDEHGTLRVVRSAAHPLDGYRWAFTIDLRELHITGKRFELSVELPDGGWQLLPDAPLLMERVVSPCLSWASWQQGINSPQEVNGKPVGSSRRGKRKVPSRRHSSAKPARPVDIIIPVYRGREETLACIDSVMRTVGDAAGLIIVDDATEESALADDLDKLAREGGIRLLRNPSNQGFVCSVNRALALNPKHDAVILNSDAVVFGDWLQRLRLAAYSHPRVGTVTPLSNSGSIASYPSAAESDMPVETAAQMHELAAGTLAGTLLEIPVGVGFCLYVRRDCLTEVGILDEAAFGKGYGEETDFCLRARHRGWTHLLAAGVFVFHSGGLSFGSRRAALLERSQRILNSRYPGYDALVAEFLTADPLARVRRQLDERRLLALRARMVLIVTLALTGGVDRFVGERCGILRRQGLLPALLRPAGPEDRRRCELSVADGCAGFPDLPNLSYDVPSDLRQLAGLLRALPIERVEIQHFLHLDTRVIEVVRELPAPYDVFVHDYSWICPRVTLIDGTGRYCGEPDVSTCDRCVRSNGSALKETLSVGTLRARSRRWIEGAREVFAPSSDTAARIGRYVGRSDITVRSHSHSPDAAWRRRQESRQRGVTRVGLIGAIGTHKGYRQLLHCARDASKRNLPLEFVVIGYTEDDAPLLATGRVFITGRYGEGEASHLLERESPDVAWFPSVWPETWCYTLDAALEAALPIVTFDIGAIAERLRERPDSVLLPLSLEPQQINDHLMQVGRPTAGEAVVTFNSKTRVPRVNYNAKTDPRQSGEPIVNENAHIRSPQRAADSELTAAVQILPLPSGLYLFSVKAATPNVTAATAALSLPAVHVGLGPGVPTDSVEFVAGPSTHGGWLFAKGDLLVTKVKGNGATLVLTSVRAPGGEALAIKVERLEARADAPAAAHIGDSPVPTEVADRAATRLVAKQRKANAVDDEMLPVRIGAHIRTRGDMMFSDVPWAGRMGPGLWIESFSVKPLERFSAQDIEYKALTGSGFETPWLSDEKMCGTKGMATPLLGFAIRLKPSSLAAAYDCEYTGYFQSGHTAGPLRNGVPCRSAVASDPLEGIQLRLIKRSATLRPTVGTGAPVSGSDRKRAMKKPTRPVARRGSA